MSDEPNKYPVDFIESVLAEYMSQRVKLIRSLLEVTDFHSWLQSINLKYPSEKQLSPDDGAPLLSLRLHLRRALHGMRRFDDIWLAEAREQLAREAEEQKRDDDTDYGGGVDTELE